MLSDDGTQIDGGFASAWSPPLPIYEQLLADGFAVKATYYEGGNAFCGVWDNDVDNYHNIPDFKSRAEINRWKQSLPEELLDIADNYSEFDESDQVSGSPFFFFRRFHFVLICSHGFHFFAGIPPQHLAQDRRRRVRARQEDQLRR